METSEAEPISAVPDDTTHLDEDMQSADHQADDYQGAKQDEHMHSPPAPPDNKVELEEVTDSDGHMVYVKCYPNPNAGKPIRCTKADDLPPEYQTYPDIGALADPENFELAKLLMESGISGRFRNQYLTLKRIKDWMPWKNNRVMLMDIDKLPCGPDWFVKTYDCPGSRGTETAECWMCDSLAMIQHLLLDQTLGKKMHWVPEKHYTNQTRKCQWRGELWTGDWLWRLQAEIGDKSATIITAIVSSYETRLTNYAGDKKAHLVYLTI
ncbi:hypothetical protein FRC11_010523, partial [Ceratobasidium sp. 423]